MVVRRERKRKRADINRYLKKHGWSLFDLKRYVDQNRHRFTQGFRTQLNKMLAERRLQDFVDGLEYEMVDGNSFPVVYCVEERGQWVFYCPFCQQKHHHGPCPGHRYSHCHSSDSPFNHGYLLKLKERDE